MRFSALLLLSIAGAVLSAEECTNPVVRKEWRNHSIEEKKEFIRAIKCMGNKPHRPNLTKTRLTPGVPLVNKSSTHYDDWVYLHVDSNQATHVVSQFFPWHRWYLHAFETDMKNTCGFNGTMPYWDWTLDAHDVYNSPIFESDPEYGLGTWGKEEDDWIVTDGAFANTLRAYPVPHYVRRRFTPQPFVNNLIFPFEYANKTAFANETFTPEAIEFLVDNFEGDSAAFFAGQLDRTWARWQARRPANARSFYGGSVQDLARYDEFPTGVGPMANTQMTLPSSGMEEQDIRIEAVMSITSNYKNKFTGYEGGILCYTYDKM
ncbi:Di-copper centre-containing protein [Rhizoctonia solani]|uniref:Di-copper centre-containing protein n=1 Tax=Rhizoctonia solani TaxID=456999 RepID=A0A8H7H1G5_9AGAM|nr:Di-copper centre-containing protein [Rhizoctonia solani]KAF8748679.1 Di-copper centre-containing protein [Rhizoctonia solani]